MSLQSDLEAEVARVWTRQTDGAHDIWHLRRVWKNCCAIADALDSCVDRDVLLIGAYLHDIVNVPKDDPRRADAAALSADHAVAWMAARGLPGQAAVAHAIRGHSYSAQAPCETLEAQVLQDADRLRPWAPSALRAVSPWRGRWGPGWCMGVTRWRATGLWTTRPMRWIISRSSCLPWPRPCTPRPRARWPQSVWPSCAALWPTWRKRRRSSPAAAAGRGGRISPRGCRRWGRRGRGLACAPARHRCGPARR